MCLLTCWYSAVCYFRQGSVGTKVTDFFGSAYIMHNKDWLRSFLGHVRPICAAYQFTSVLNMFVVGIFMVRLA